MARFVRRYPLVKFAVFNVLAVLAYDILRHNPARAAVEPPAVVSTVQSIPTYVADADRDVGPGNSEPLLARHDL
ncbi:MAG TPA: hypothetical protein VFD38_05535 [Myxococcaceae bacterium]|nr:hypothetical protein [Myxococcaceae bacterium]